MTVTSELEARLSSTVSGVWGRLEREGCVHPDAARLRPGLPGALERVLVRAIESERAAGRDAEAEALVRHYTELMPALLVEQIASTRATGAELVHAPLRWPSLPRMESAIRRLFALVERLGLRVADVVGWSSADAFLASARTLAAWYPSAHYGGCMPLLYAYPQDLAYFLSRGWSLDATLDRYLTAPVIHELCHFAGGVLNPHLDECVAGWLGVHLLPAFAYPEPGHDDALYASPWLAQIGAAMVRVFGLEAVVRAHAGAPDALPADFVRDADVLYWQLWHERRPLHLLADTMQPKPWLELIVGDRELAADPGADRSIAADALRAMCVETTLEGGSFRTRTVVPAAPIVIEPGRVSTAPKNALDVAPPSYWLPPTVHVPARREVTLERIEDIPALAATLIP